MFHVKQNKKGDNMAIKKERKTRTVAKKILTRAQRIADAIDSLDVARMMIEDARNNKNPEMENRWVRQMSGLKDNLRDLGIPVGWREETVKEVEDKKLPIQQDIPFD